MNLEQQKKQARELLKGVRAGDAEALARLRRSHARWSAADAETVRREAALHDAQFVLAREQGFASWTRLKAYAEASRDPRHSRLYVASEKWLEERAQGLLRTFRSAGPAALEQVREWHPAFGQASDEEILRASLTIDDARLVYAREHGCESWAELLRRVESVEGEPFLMAFRALEKGELAAFREMLTRRPQLARERGTNGNTLLNLAVSLGRDVGALLEAGADVNDGNDRGWTALHAAAYRNDVGTVRRLIEAGADVEMEAHGSGGTPLIAALFWGHREAADALAEVSLAPGNLRALAGTGRLERVEWNAEASAARGFYRPHSGFPDWRPSGDRQEVLDEALVWASKSGRMRAMAVLVEAGARVDADPYRGTPLIWAAFCNRVEAAGWLINHGAPVNQKATFGGLSHGEGITALHLAAQNGHLEMVKLLIARGADPAIREDLYGADAAGAAKFFGQAAVLEYLLHL